MFTDAVQAFNFVRGIFVTILIVTLSLLAPASVTSGEETTIRIEKTTFIPFDHKLGACCFDSTKAEVWCVQDNHLWSRRIHASEASWIDEGGVTWHGDVELVSIWRMAHDAISGRIAIATADGRIVIRDRSGEGISKRRFPFLLTTNPEVASLESAEKEAFVTSGLGISQIAFCNSGTQIAITFFDGSILKANSKTMEVTSVALPSPWKWQCVRRTAVIPQHPDPFHRDPQSTLRVDVSSMRDFFIAIDTRVRLTTRAVSPQDWDGVAFMEVASGIDARIPANGSIAWRSHGIERTSLCADDLFGMSVQDGDVGVVRLRCSDGIQTARWSLEKDAVKPVNSGPVLVKRLPDKHQYLIAIATKRDVVLCQMDDRREFPIKIMRSMPVPIGNDIASSSAFIGSRGMVVECTQGFVLLDFAILQDGVPWVE